MDKVVISTQEITEIQEVPEQPVHLEPKLTAPIPLWLRLGLSVLVLGLPLLCLLAIILRVAFRTQPPRTRYAWTEYLATLLIISGFLTSIGAVLVFSFVPLPEIVSPGLAELDERIDFPGLPSKTVLSATDASQQLKSLVAVISPTREAVFGKREMLSNEFGAGLLLQANSAGYLFTTARHVVGSDWDVRKKKRALISLASGLWAGADVIARHNTLDLALLWLPRHSGDADFSQPIARPKEGESIFVIGHPEGLRFTLSTGIVSRLRGSILQISAPVSPGNSGGPVYDANGSLIGVVVSTMDKSINPNAENLNFAVGSEALLKESGWEFAAGGREHFKAFLNTSSAEKQASGSKQTSPGPKSDAQH